MVKQARAALMVTQNTGISYGGMGSRPEQLCGETGQSSTYGNTTHGN